MSELRPLIPLLSRFPLPMSESEARREGRRARRSKLQLPAGHPYAVAPTWMPLKVALHLEHIRIAVFRRRPAGRFRED